jgi:hypothetical protein
LGDVFKLPVLADTLIFAHGNFSGIDEGDAGTFTNAMRHNKHKQW